METCEVLWKYCLNLLRKEVLKNMTHKICMLPQWDA